MTLLPENIRPLIPALYSGEQLTEEEQGNRNVHVKFFTPWTNWTWYVLEGQEQDGDFLFFGYVEGFENEFGYFSLRELESAKGPFGLSIERDLYWTPRPIREIAKDFYARSL
jgi:hypothetical protein